MNNSQDKMIQYIVWTTCKNHCKFCAIKYCVQNDDRVNNIKRINDLLDLDEVNEVSKISLMGGEIFDTQFSNELRELFYKLIDKIFSLNKRLFLMTNLLYDKNIELSKTIDHIRNIGHLNDTVICTSYELEGRFHNEKSLGIFKENCEYIKNNAILHIEMIICSSLLKGVLNDTFSFKDFFEEYTDNVDFVPPYPGQDEKHLPNDFIEGIEFFPKRETFFKFLKKCFLEDKVINPNKFLNRNLHSCILYFFKEGVYTKQSERQSFGNMHFDQYNYIDDYKHTMYSDYNMFREMYNF